MVSGMQDLNFTRRNTPKPRKSSVWENPVTWMVLIVFLAVVVVGAFLIYEEVSWRQNKRRLQELGPMFQDAVNSKEPAPTSPPPRSRNK